MKTNLLLSEYPSKIFIGERDGKKIYLSAPRWDCGWYWGFGYLGNENCHYPVDGLTKHESYDFDKNVWKYEFTNLYDGFKKHFGNSLIVRDSQLWKLAELFKTFYTLRETAEVLGRGGSHYTSNPCENVIKNPEEVKRINEVVLPAIFEAIYKILIPAQNNKTLDKKLVNLFLEGDTSKVVDFMLENSIHTDDLKSIQGLTSADFNVIHSAYWTRYHANKK